MMRVFIKVLFLIIIIICIGAPFAMGFIIQNRYHEMLHKLNAGYGQQMSFEGKFERGFFTSHAITTISDSNNEKVVLDHKVYHGPIVFKYSGWLKAINYKPEALALAVIDTQIMSPLVDKILALYQNDKAYEITTRVEFNSDLHTKFTNYPLKTTFNNKDIDWKGFFGILDIKHDTANISLTLDAPYLKYTELTMQNSRKNLEINDTKVNFKRNMVNNHEAFALTIDKAKFNDNATSLGLDINNIELKLDTTMMQNILGILFNFNFSKVQVDDQAAGPFNFELKLQNLNYDAIRNLSQATRALARQQSDVTGDTPPALTLPQAEFQELLKTRPIIDFDLFCTLPLGDIVYDSHLEIGGENIVTMNAQEIWAHAIFTKKIKISKAIVNKILLKIAQQKFYNNAKIYTSLYPNNDTINPYNEISEQERKNIFANWANNVLYILKQKQIIKDEDGFISMNFEFKNDILIINGKQITQADINEITPMLSMPMLTPRINNAHKEESSINSNAEQSLTEPNIKSN